MTQSSEFSVLLGNTVVDFDVLETGGAWLNLVLLAHFEVLSEVLVTAPPVQVDHTESLVAALLINVGVLEIVLLSVVGEAAILVSWTVLVVGLSNAMSPVLAHFFFLVLH